MIEENILEAAVECLKLEEEALNKLQQLLFSGNSHQDSSGGDFAKSFCSAINLIGSIKGRVVLTGMGKSGHIARKIAASFASTGTLAFFVHAAEANHGDLGMINSDDVILALSWSGETAELSGVINHAARFSIPLISITAGKNSTLAKESDIVLLLPKLKEACPHGLAPTTSTLMQLAIGDALTVALLRRRGFTSEDFKLFHPGGSLGAQLHYVGDVMHGGELVPVVPIGTMLPEAVKVLASKHFGCVIIVDELGDICGIITDGDLARYISRDLVNTRVEEIMTRNPKTIAKKTLLTQAALLIQQHQIGVLIVVEDKKPVGLLHFHDLLRLNIL